MADEFDPSTRSTVAAARMADWALIRAVRGGAQAVRNEGVTFLPKFSSEQDEDYAARILHSPYTAIYEDSTRSLIGKPFSKEVKLQGQIPPDMATWCENIDLAGNNLHNFAKSWFGEALHMGLAFALADYPRTDTPAQTLGEERSQGKRPYARLIPADDMFAIYNEDRGGKTVIRQIRFRDDTMELNDMEEKKVERVRVLDDVEGVITQRVFVKDDKGWTLDNDQSGPLTGPTEIYVVPLIFGLEIDGKFGIKPAMLDLAYKQVEHFRQANRVDQLLEFSGFAMLQAEGMGPPTYTDEEGKVQILPIRVGPRTVLFAPPAQENDRPKWSWLSPDADVIEVQQSKLESIESEMRSLGLQPHMPSQGAQNLTATTSAINAARTHSTIQAWAMTLKDALEQLLVFMARWPGLPETAEVFVHTDFSPETLADKDEKLLLEMHLSSVISRDTLWDEMSRRGILGPQFDKLIESARIEADPSGTGLPTEPPDDDETTGEE